MECRFCAQYRQQLTRTLCENGVRDSPILPTLLSSHATELQRAGFFATQPASSYYQRSIQRLSLQRNKHFSIQCSEILGTYFFWEDYQGSTVCASGDRRCCRRLVLRELYLETQSVPRSKHAPSLLYKPVS